MECGIEAVLTTVSLSPNIMEGPSTGTPRYRSVRRRSMTSIIAWVGQLLDEECEETGEPWGSGCVPASRAGSFVILFLWAVRR